MPGIGYTELAGNTFKGKINMLYIAQNLKSLRKAKDITQEEAAELLGVSPQSVSKWERGETTPDIGLLPALANLYKVSVDTLLGMEKINDREIRNDIFTKAHQLMHERDYAAAAGHLADASRTYPNDEGIMSELAIALALSGDCGNLNRAIELCSRLLEGGGKVHHTARAALSFIYLRAGEREKALDIAKKLPHVWESRETILSKIKKNPSDGEIDTYLLFIALGETVGESELEVDFGLGLVEGIVAVGLVEQIGALRRELGGNRLPPVRIRDNQSLRQNQLRLRHNFDYLLDSDIDDCAGAVETLISALRDIAGK